jgi:signal transduction protein with GAF and PtsI domain
MRRISKVVVVLGVAVLLAVPALAQQRQQGQQGPGAGGFGGGLAGLIENAGVQQELKLDTEQVEKAKAAVDKVREKHSADRAKLQDLSQEERREQSRAINQAVSEETMKALEHVL